MSSDNPPKKSIKQRLIELQGQKAPIDLFLYSCWEQEKILKALSTPPKSKKRLLSYLPPQLRGWNLDFDSPSVEKNPESFLAAWKNCTHWYQKKYPELFASTIFDHEFFGQFALPAVDLINDLNRLYDYCFSQNLPFFPHGEQNSPADGVWKSISQVLTEVFPSTSPLLIEYLRWSFREEIREVFEPGSRPPVGRYAPPPIRKESFRTNKGRDSDRRGPPRDKSRNVQTPEFKKPQISHEKDHDSSRRKSSGHKSPHKHPKTSKPNDDQTARNTERVLAEVDQALETLRLKPELNEVRLSPQNSFYRRIQHQKVVDAGYISISVGEGPDRAVTIQRQ